jgi:Fe/S biogenesis protein NfuA
MANEASTSDRAEAAPAITFTDQASSKLHEVISGFGRPVAGLRLQIVGRSDGEFQHVLSLIEEGQEHDGDALIEVDGIPVYLERRNLPYLNGVEVDYRYKGPNISGLEFMNPNPLWLDEASQRIQQLFDEQINPSIAAHGGYVNLLAVEGDTAYVELGGGCVGCGMADVTLKQGIEVAIKETVPSIERVVDSTDHASGTNPYFKPGKK